MPGSFRPIGSESGVLRLLIFFRAPILGELNHKENDRSH